MSHRTTISYPSEHEPARSDRIAASLLPDRVRRLLESSILVTLERHARPMTAGELSFVGGLQVLSRAADRNAVIRDLVNRGVLATVEVRLAYQPSRRLVGYELARKRREGGEG